MEEITKFYSINPPGLMRRENDMWIRQKESIKTGFDSGEMPIAMAYVPWQKWQNIYENDKGIIRGTIFADLDKPFKGAKR